MKTYFFKSCIILLGLLLINNPMSSQGKFELSGGFGSPELLSLKIKYGKNIQIALSQTVPMHWEYSTVMGPTAAEIYYHFYGKSKYIDRKPWYLLGGIIFWWEPAAFYPRLGRSINFSRRIGINLDAGILIPLGSDIISEFEPSGYISFLIRL